MRRIASSIIEHEVIYLYQAQRNVRGGEREENAHPRGKKGEKNVFRVWRVLSVRAAILTRHVQ